ncbi:MAG: extensin family protein [Sandaracinaceae bacterium]|nr:extensin family protein [Sandaracinaceae bacterium]
MRQISLALLLLAASAPAQAQSIAELRDQVAEVRQNRPPSVPEGTLTSIEYLLDVSERIERRFPTQSATWRERAARFLASAAAGRDPYPEGANQLLNRGYQPTFSPLRQGYAVYLPPNYDPSRAYPLMIMLHGGSSNGNLFLGVVLGNNMDWLRYNQFLYDDFTPRWSPDWIVVAPDGVGQLIWRWMGEQDVLEVLDDVQRHYNVDPNRVVLGGLSNGGMGAYTIGTRHAWRFSAVQAMAGAPSWIQYAGGRASDVEMTTMRRYSAMDLFENTENTDFRYYHGTIDPGPMRPAYVRELDQRVAELGVRARGRWYVHGHDLLYLVHRHGRVYPDLAEIVRNPHPAEVRLVTGDYRANRQHWVTVTRIEDYPVLAHVRATASDGAIEATTDNVLQISFDLRDAPLGSGDTVRVVLDGTEVYSGPRRHLGHVVSFARDPGEGAEEGDASGDAGAWRLGFLPEADGLEKVPGLAGPMTDAYHDMIVHVYGTQHPANEATLRRTAETGARGWPMGVWYLEQRVVRDTDVTPEMMQSAHLALYGGPGDNAVLDRMLESLPIRAEADGITMSNGHRFEGRQLGARFIYPNPEQPGRYVLVHTGTTADMVSRTRNLPDFVPDYVVYDARAVGSRPRLLMQRGRDPLASGFFDRFWRLPEYQDPHAARLPAGVSAEQMRALAIRVGAPPTFILPAPLFQQTPAPQLEPGDMPAPPERPRRFLAAASDPNGPVARQIARMVPTFYNYRAIIPGGAWIESQQAVFQIRPQRDCLSALDRAHVPYQLVDEDLHTPVPTAVEITGPVNGVRFRTVRAESRVIISCEMASRLPLLTRIARRQDVRGITILSSHRERPRQSFHTLGMALDIFSFETSHGTLSVLNDFIETPAHPTCDAPEPADPKARALLRIACDLVESREFNSVLTPNYNDGHRNHFHVDIRPDDDRVFVR